MESQASIIETEHPETSAPLEKEKKRSLCESGLNKSLLAVHKMMHCCQRGQLNVIPNTPIRPHHTLETFALQKGQQSVNPATPVATTVGHLLKLQMGFILSSI